METPGSSFTSWLVVMGTYYLNHLLFLLLGGQIFFPSWCPWTLPLSAAPENGKVWWLVYGYVCTPGNGMHSAWWPTAWDSQQDFFSYASGTLVTKLEKASLAGGSWFLSGERKGFGGDKFRQMLFDTVPTESHTLYGPFKVNLIMFHEERADAEMMCSVISTPIGAATVTIPITKVQN